MFIDAREVAAGTIIETALCIVGTGPAATAMALELAGSGIDLVMLESGELEESAVPESLNQGVPGESGYSPYHLRSRRFGGTSPRWNHRVGDTIGYCRFVPFDEYDLEHRDWLPYSGWPITYADLAPYYRRAEARCGLDPRGYEADAWATPDAPQIPFPGSPLHTMIFQFGLKTRHCDVCKEVVDRFDRVRCFTNSTAIGLIPDETETEIRGIEVATPSGGRYTVKANRYVIATGGIESARLLLASDRVSPSGIGNRHDLVGRFYMDHYMMHSGYLFPFDRTIFDRMALYDLRAVDGGVITARLSLSQDFMQSNHLLNSATYLLPRHPTAHLRDWGTRSFRGLRSAARERRIPSHLGRHMQNLAKLLLHGAFAAYRRLIRKRLQFTWIAAGGWSDLPDKQSEFRSLEVVHLVEQVPDPDNRVTLSEKRDRYGCRMPKVDCSLNSGDLDSLRRLQQFLTEEFRRAGVGRLVLTATDDPINLTPNGSGHHMGTTRMHVDPRQGVVDPDCRVHGISNLYIASSSVFPTGSYANPTLTILALAIRLADHLKAVHEPSVILGSPVGGSEPNLIIV